MRKGLGTGQEGRGGQGGYKRFQLAKKCTEGSRCKHVMRRVHLLVFLKGSLLVRRLTLLCSGWF